MEINGKRNTRSRTGRDFYPVDDIKVLGVLKVPGNKGPSGAWGQQGTYWSARSWTIDDLPKTPYGPGEVGMEIRTVKC